MKKMHAKIFPPYSNRNFLHAPFPCSKPPAQVLSPQPLAKRNSTNTVWDSLVTSSRVQNLRSAIKFNLIQLNYAFLPCQLCHWINKVDYNMRIVKAWRSERNLWRKTMKHLQLFWVVLFLAIFFQRGECLVGGCRGWDERKAVCLRSLASSVACWAPQMIGKWELFLSRNFLGLSVPATAGVTEDPDDEDFDEEDSSEADDDGRVYKNPRNHPSPDCPRDEEQATLLGTVTLKYVERVTDHCTLYF